MSEQSQPQGPEMDYIIPVPLERSIASMKLNLSSKSLNFPPIPVKVLISLLLGLGLTFWVGTSSNLITYASGWLQVLYYLFFTFVVIYLSTFDKAGDMRAEQVLTLLSYLPKPARSLKTRGNMPAKGFADFVGFDVSEGDPVEENGVIHLRDGRIARAYLVVGNASLLVFLQDKLSILKDVNSYWQAVDSETEHLFLTTKEPQRVHHQVAHLEYLSRNLIHDEPDLRDLLDEQYQVQRDFVGKQFKSTHQYLVLMTPHMDALRSAEDALMSAAADASHGFVKVAVPLDAEDFVESFSSLYQGRSYT